MSKGERTNFDLEEKRSRKKRKMFKRAKGKVHPRRKEGKKEKITKKAEI